MHQGHRERLRQRYSENGLSGFADHEALELLLQFAIPRKDTNETAHALINHFGSLAAVFSADAAALCEVPGVGMNTAILLTLFPEFERRIALGKSGPRPQLNTPVEAAKYLTALFQNEKTEAFYVLHLDNQKRLIRAEKISQGSGSETTVEARAVVQSCLKSGAASVILAHNHPGGTLTPSRADIQLTEALKTALSYIHVDVIDHIIVAEDRCYAINSHRSFSSRENDGLSVLPAPSVNRVKQEQSAVDPEALAHLLTSLDLASLDLLISTMEAIERDEEGKH